MISQRVWFWFPFLMLLGLIGCLVDSLYFRTFYGVMGGSRTLYFTQVGGVIEARLFEETHIPVTVPLRFAGNRKSTPPGIARRFFPTVRWSGPDHPTPGKSWLIRVPHFFLIGIYLVAWLGTRRWWQRRKSRLLKLYAAPLP